MLAGTDTGDRWVVPGFGLHDELKAMVGAGFTPLEALTTATLGPARYFQLESPTEQSQRIRLQISFCWMPIQSRISGTPDAFTPSL